MQTADAMQPNNEFLRSRYGLLGLFRIRVLVSRVSKQANVPTVIKIKIHSTEDSDMQLPFTLGEINIGYEGSKIVPFIGAPD